MMRFLFESQNIREQIAQQEHIHIQAHSPYFMNFTSICARNYFIQNPATPHNFMQQSLLPIGFSL